MSLIIEIKNSFSRITTDCIKIIFNKVKEPDLKISSLKAEMLTFLCCKIKVETENFKSIKIISYQNLTSYKSNGWRLCIDTKFESAQLSHFKYKFKSKNKFEIRKTKTTWQIKCRQENNRSQCSVVNLLLLLISFLNFYSHLYT